MHGGLVLPKARTFSNDKLAWLLALLLLGLIYFAYQYLAHEKKMDTAHIGKAVSDPILLVLSYGHIKKSTDEQFVTQAQLEDHLNAIQAQGFVPVSIEQVKDFYIDSAPLPEKSVLLLFEHGFLATYENVDPVLRAMRWRATMAVSTQRIQERNTTFLYWDRLQRMLNSGLWDIASAGHVGHESTRINRAGEQGSALLHRRWLADQEKYENDAQLSTRIHHDYSQSKDLLEEKLSGLSIQAYVSPYGDISRLSKDYHILKANEEALQTSYSLGFVDDEFGINDRHTHPYQLNRLRISPGWSGQKLEQYIIALLKNPIISGQTDVVAKDWVVGVGKADQQGEKILLQGERRADIWMPGGQWAEFWKIEADLKLDSDQQFWIVQHDTQIRGAFWRLGGDADTLNLQYSENGEKVETLYSFKKSINIGEYHHIVLNKRGQGIWVEWDNEPLSEHPVYLPGEWRGKVGWIVWNEGDRAQLSLREPRLTLLPLRVQAVNAYPSRQEVQQLTRQASQLGALAFPRWRFNNGQVNTLDADNDLLRLLAHRYGWKLIPTICIASRETHRSAWNKELKRFVQTLLNREVNQDPGHIAAMLEPAEVSRIRETFSELNRKLVIASPSAFTAQSQQGSCDSVLRSNFTLLKGQSASST